jgi:hypothetical protein
MSLSEEREKKTFFAENATEKKRKVFRLNGSERERRLICTLDFIL